MRSGGDGIRDAARTVKAMHTCGNGAIRMDHGLGHERSPAPVDSPAAERERNHVDAQGVVTSTGSSVGRRGSWRTHQSPAGVRAGHRKDGLLIGVSFAIGERQGLLVTIAMTLEVLFLAEQSGQQTGHDDAFLSVHLRHAAVE